MSKAPGKNMRCRATVSSARCLIHVTRALLLGFLILISGFQPSYGKGENDWFVPLGKPPEAPPKRISGGEGFPPLPCPPLRCVDPSGSGSQRLRRFSARLSGASRGPSPTRGETRRRFPTGIYVPPTSSVFSTRCAKNWACSMASTMFRSLRSTATPTKWRCSFSAGRAR